MEEVVILLVAGIRLIIFMLYLRVYQFNNSLIYNNELTNCVNDSIAGDVKFWDPRFTESVKTINTQCTLSAMDVHKEADIFVWYNL